MPEEKIKKIADSADMVVADMRLQKKTAKSPC